MMFCFNNGYVALLYGVVVSPVHEDNERDHEDGYCVEDDTANESGDVELLGQVGILFGFGILLIEFELLGAGSQVHGYEAEQRTTAAEDAQPGTAEGSL